MAPDDIGDDLALPAGLPGSGRRRYAAAMALHAAGRLDAAALEGFRTLSPRDGDDPALLGLPRPAADRGAGAALGALRGELLALMGSLRGPGLAEARALLAEAGGEPRACGRGPHPVVEQWLPAALAALPPALVPAVAAAARHLGWTAYAYADPAIGPAFPEGHAYAPLAGEGGPWALEGAEVGLFLMAPRLLYRDHAHAAPELYLPLTGPHRWRFVPGAPFAEKPALRPVWNDPHRPHAILTGAVPFLALYAWTGALEEPAHVLPAPDWGQIEEALHG